MEEDTCWLGNINMPTSIHWRSLQSNSVKNSVCKFGSVKYTTINRLKTREGGQPSLDV